MEDDVDDEADDEDVRATTEERTFDDKDFINVGLTIPVNSTITKQTDEEKIQLII